MKKTAVSVLLNQADYKKLKELSNLESRTMASWIRNTINENYKALTPLEKNILKVKEDVRV